MTILVFYQGTLYIDDNVLSDQVIKSKQTKYFYNNNHSVIMSFTGALPDNADIAELMSILETKYNKFLLTQDSSNLHFTRAEHELFTDNRSRAVFIGLNNIAFELTPNCLEPITLRHDSVMIHGTGGQRTLALLRANCNLEHINMVLNKIDSYYDGGLVSIQMNDLNNFVMPGSEE